jgi:hypothetical protein
VPSRSEEMSERLSDLSHFPLLPGISFDQLFQFSLIKKEHVLHLIVILH